MIKDIPASVARVVMARGAVYVRVARTLLEAGLSLQIGPARAHFEEIPDEDVAVFGFPLEYRPEFDPDDLGHETAKPRKTGSKASIAANAANTDARTVAKAQAAPVTETEPEADAGTAAETAPAAEAEAEADARTVAKAEMAPATEAEPEAHAGTAAQAAPLTETEPEAHAGTAAEAAPVTEAEPEAEAESDTVTRIFTPMLNALSDWTLEDHATLQIRMERAGAPARFDLAAPIVLPRHGTDLEFSVLMAAHRAAGRLVVRTEDLEGRLLDIFEVPFDTVHPGGRYFQGYKKVVRQLPPCHEKSVIRLQLQYDRNLGGPDDPEPYFFVADPHVMRKARPASVPAEELHNDPASTGLDQVWARAPVPAPLPAGADLDLVAGDHRTPLMTGGEARITLVADHGHTIMLEATEAGRFRFQIDGEPAFEAFVGTVPTAVRLPSRFFNGETRRFTAWDGLGVQRLLDSYVLMPRMLTPIEVMRQESRPPYPGTISAQAARRFAGVKAQLARGLDPATLEQVSYALDVLEGGHENVRLQPLFFPEVEDPDVSIVIPAHNKVEVTYLALASLLVAGNEASFEVIVVDDASTDATNELEMLVEGITVLHNPEPERFIRSCNAGVSVARGKYVVLLNNDTEVTAGWLDELIAAFGRFPDVGLVGSKLLYPDGKLQDGGGIVWGSGNPWNYGQGQNPWDPRFCYARQVDYLSGAALMTTKTIWDEVGGLSSYLEPMYFEDTDLAFKVREAGYTTWFVPSSIVYHYEGMTSGTDTSSGFKRYQEVNRPKFKRRWAAAYRNNGKDGVDTDLAKDRNIAGRVLFIDHGTPRPDRDAGSYAAVQEIRLVQSLGYKVTFLPVNLAHLGHYTEVLERMGVEMIHAPYFLSVSDFLEQRAAEFDAFFITRYSVAETVLDPIRLYAPKPRILFNNADLHFLRELRAGLAADDAGMIAAAASTRERELEVMRQADVVLSYNETEHSVIASHTDGEVAVVRCPWVVEQPASVPPREGRAGMSFLGNYQHPPNADAVEWFVREVMPLVNAEDPDLNFWIYGSGLPGTLKALEGPTVHPEGFVPEVADAYDRHRIFVAPLLSGAGIKGKVLAALAHGVPCVLSPVAAEGIGLRHGLDCMIAQTPEEWAAAIGKLQKDDALWDRLSANARDYVRDTFSFETGRKWMREAFEAADLFTAAEL